jgi:hypothetical protein
MAEAGSSSPAAPTFLAQEVCSHPEVLPVHALQLSTLPERWNIIGYNDYLKDRAPMLTSHTETTYSNHANISTSCYMT